jgi:hypothetical protein
MVACLWLAIVAPLLCSVHDGTHNHLLSSHHVAGHEPGQEPGQEPIEEPHEHVHDQTAFDTHSHKHTTNQLPDSHCETVGDTYWALTMTVSASDSTILPEPLLSSTSAPVTGALFHYYPPPPDRPPRFL